ncbi:MAG: hypothetical protein Q8P67_12045, partial [archaeon]|nr:hypothetical protein [archaeon]
MAGILRNTPTKRSKKQPEPTTGLLGLRLPAAPRSALTRNSGSNNRMMVAPPVTGELLVRSLYASALPTTPTTTRAPVELTPPPRHAQKPSIDLSRSGADQDQGSPESESASDRLVRFLLGEFKSLTRIIITVISHQSVETEIALPVYLSSDLEPEFDQLVCSLQTAAKHFLPVILKALITWREYQTFDPEEMKQRVKDGKSRLSLKDAVAVMVERHHLLIDYIFASTLLRLFEVYDEYKECSQSSNLIDLTSTWKDLFSIALKFFMDRTTSSRPPSPQNALNRDAVEKLFIAMVKALSSRQFEMVLTVLSETKSLLPSTDNRPKGLANLAALSAVALPLPAPDRSITAFFSEFDALLKVKQRDAMKVVVDSLAQILQNTASHFQTMVRQGSEVPSQREWNTVCKHTYEEYASKKKKGIRSTSIFSSSNTTQAAGTVLCPLLCLCDTEFFNATSGQFIHDLGSKLVKDSEFAGVALKLLTLICQAQLTTHAPAFAIETQKIGQISSSVFHKKWTVALQPDHSVLYVDFLTMLAQHRLDLTLHRLREIFAMTDAGTLIERHFIVAKAMFQILRAAFFR